jgi:hypothetical protein
MTQTLQSYLDRFKLSQIEFALAIGVNPRTVRRWNGHLPAPILRLLEAWAKLDDCGLSFIPNSMDLDLSMSGINLLTRSEIKNRVRPLENGEPNYENTNDERRLHPLLSQASRDGNATRSRKVGQLMHGCILRSTRYSDVQGGAKCQRQLKRHQ